MLSMTWTAQESQNNMTPQDRGIPGAPSLQRDQDSTLQLWPLCSCQGLMLMMKVVSYCTTVLVRYLVSLILRRMCTTALHLAWHARIFFFLLLFERFSVIGMSKSHHCPSAGIAVAFDHFDSFLRHTALFRSSSGAANLLFLIVNAWS